MLDAKRVSRIVLGKALVIGLVLGLASTMAEAQVSFSLAAPSAASTCDSITLTNTFQNLGNTLDALIITNALPAGTVYVTNQSTVTLPSGQVLTGAAAEPSTNRGGTNLVWDFTAVTSDSGISHLLISEVFYDPTGANEETNEWIELYNPTAAGISLAGYTIADAIPGQSDALTGVTVDPGQFVIVAASTGAFYAAHAGYTGLVIGVTDDTLGSSLNNFADGIFLKDASAATVDAVSYGGSSAAFSPAASVVTEGQSLTRNPVNADNNNRNDWVAASPSPGAGTVLTGVSPSSTIRVTYKVELSCSAQTAYFRAGARYQQPAGGAMQTVQAAWNLTVETPNLTVTKRPSVQSAGYGDTVVWTVRVENAGYGRADNVVVTDTRGPGIRFRSFSAAPTNAAPYSNLTSVSWNASAVPALAAMDEGAVVSIVITGEVAACTGLYNNVTVRNGCQGLQMVPDQTCFDSAAGGNEGGSVEFIYRYALVSASLGPSASFTLPYCEGRDITLHLTNAPGADIGTALSIQLEPVLPTGYTLSGAGYNTNLNRIVVGDLAAGATTSVTLRLRAGGSCPLDLSQQMLTFRPSYTDACGTPYTTPPLTAYSTLTNEPAARVTKVVSSVSGQASSLTVRVLFSYDNLTNTVVSFADQLPANSYWWVTNVAGGGITSGSTVVRWNKTLSGSGVFTGTFDLVWHDTCNIGGSYGNTVTASNFTDCAGCTRAVSGSGEVYYFGITGYNCPTGSPGTGTCSFAVANYLPTVAEVCESVAITSRISGITDATTNNWDGVVFSNNLAAGQARASTNALRVLVDGVDYTAYVYVSLTNPALRLSFTNMNGTAVPRPGLATNIDIAWTVVPTNTGQGSLSSSFTLPGCSTRSASSGWSIGQGALTVALQPLVGQDACGISFGHIDLAETVLPALSSLSNRFFSVYDVEVVLDLDVNANGTASYSYVTNSTSFSNLYALAGGALAAVEPSVSATQLVWALGDLRTNSAVGSVHFRLQGSCSAESGEKTRALVRFNGRCQDGATPSQVAYSTTNAAPALYAATLSANLEPEISFLPGTTYVFRVELFNSGAGTAFNVTAEVAKPSNIALVSASAAPAVSSATNLVWTFQFADSPGGLVDADSDGYEDDLPPNASVGIYVTNFITACDPTVIRLTAASGCKGSTCQTSQDTAEFVPSSPSLNAATTFPNNHNLCATGIVSLAIRNSGAGRAYDVEARHTIPHGVAYLSGTARVSIDGGATNAVADPFGTGTSADPLMWDRTLVGTFADMAPNQEVRILYDVFLDCESVLSSQVYHARTIYRDNCGNVGTNDVSSATVVPGTPVLSITKLARNVTLGQASFSTATTPGNPGDVIAYRIDVDHTVASLTDLQAMKLTDVLPDTITYLGAAPAPDSISGRTLVWSNTTLMSWVGGSPYLRSASAFSIYITGTVATCTANVQNLSYINYGCSPQCLSLGATSRVYHTFTPSLSSTFNSQDGMQLNEAGGQLTITVTNTGGAAVSLVVTQAAPSGYLITGASVTGEYTSSSLTMNLTGSPAGQTGIVDFTSTATSGATDQDDDLANGLSNLDLGYGNFLRITFNLVSDGSNADCAGNPLDYDYADPDPADPVSVTARFASGSRDACDQPQQSSATVSAVPYRPDPDIDVQPNELLVTNNEVVTFTITIKNRGEQGNASNLHVRARFGPGWTNLTVTGTSIVQSAGGTVLTEVQGSSNLLVRLSGVALDPLDDQVVLTLRGTAREGSGGLEIVGEVVGEWTDPAVPSTCTPTNTLGEAPMADTMTGSVIGAVNGKYYSFDQDRSRVAGFLVKKTVRLAGDPAPGVTNLNARIGEDLVYRIESRIFGITISNLVITESLPANLVFATPYDAGSSANISNVWSYQAGTGVFTLPTPLGTDAVFVVDIPVVVSNRAGNQGDAPAPVTFTNAATAEFDADGVTNPPPPTLTQVTLLEPALQISKSASSGSAKVEAGDLVIFTNVVSHTGTSLTNAYDVYFVDSLPNGLTFAGVNLGADGLDNDGDGVADGADAADEATLVVGSSFIASATNNSALGSLGLAQQVTFRVPAYVLNQTLGSTLVNTGRVTWTSLPGVATNRNERDGSGGVNDYTASSTASITSSPVAGITKTLVSTSEAGTSDPRVTIGERLVYRIRVDFPPGSVSNAVIVDNVATGLDWLGSTPAAGLAYPTLGYGFYIPPGGPQLATNAAMGLVVTDPDPTPTRAENADGSGRAVTFTIGGITNAPDGIDTNDYFDLFMEFVVLSQTINNGLSNPAYSNINRATYSDTFNSLGATSAYYVIGEPDVRLHKRRSPATGPTDAGDIITFALVASNLQTATANTYDLLVTDNLTNRNWDLSTIAMVEEAVGWTFSAVTNVNYVQVRFASSPGTYLAPGQQATNRFSVAVADIIGANTFYTNRGDIAYSDTISGTPPVGTTGRVDTANATATLSNRNFVITKTLHTTSETGPVDSTTTNVQVGEAVTYLLRVTVPEGVHTNLSVTDVLPPGLSYALGTASNDFTGFAGTMGAMGESPSGAGLAAGGVAPVFTFSGVSTVTSDNDTNNNTFSLYVTAVVRDTNTTFGVSGNTTFLTNRASVTYPANPRAAVTSAAVVVRALEPSLAIFKNIIQTNADAGDLLTIDLVVTNSGLAAAYDLEIRDPLDAFGANPATVVPVTVPPGFSLTVSNNAVHVQASEGAVPPSSSLEPAESLSIRFQVALSDSVPPLSVLTNAATVAQGDTISGTNLYGVQRSAAGAQAQDTIASGSVGLSKELLSTGETGPSDSTNALVQVGEVVTYRLTVALPEGTITNLQVVDVLPAGLAFVQGSASVDTGSFNGSLPALGVSPSGSGLAANGQDVTLSWNGATVVAGDNLDTNNAFLVSLQAVVLDVAGNQGLSGAQTILTNSAVLSLQGGPSTYTSGVVAVTVIEPQLSLGKTFSTSAGDAGDAVTVTLVLTNSGLAAAYDLRIEDTVEARYFDASRIVTGTVPAGFSLVVTGSPDPTLVIASLPSSGQPTNSIEPREFLQFTFTSYLAQAVQPSQVASNRAVVTAAGSISGTADFGEERSAAGATAYATLSISNVAVAKQLIATSATGVVDTVGTNLTIGEVGTYRFTVTLPEGTVSNLVLTDVLPDGLVYVGGSASVDTAGFGGALPGAPVVTGGASSGDDVVLTFSGATAVTNDNNGANNSFAVTLQARVADVAAADGLGPSVDGDAQAILTNRLAAGCVGCGGSSLTSTPVVITVQEPYAEITKQVVSTTGLYYRTTVAVTNRGTSTAYDIRVQDFFPTSIWNTATLVAGSLSGYTVAWSNDVEGVWLTISSATNRAPPTNSLESGEGFFLSVTGAVVVDFTATAVNTATVTRFTTLSGTVADERDEPDVSAAAVFGAPDIVAFLRGTDINGLPLVGGDRVLYRITVTNTGGARATGVHVTDFVPTNTALVANSVTNRGQGVDVSTGLFTLDVGDLDAGEVAIISYMVTINGGLPQTVTSIYNRATATWNESTRTEVADNDPTGHATLLNDTLDDAADFGSLTDDDDPTILPLSSAEFSLTKALIKPPGRPANVSEVVQFLVTITNIGGVRLLTMPVTDTYESSYLTFASALPPASDSVNDGVLTWPNLGALNSGSATSILLTFTAKTATSGAHTNLVSAAPTAQPPYPSPAAKTSSAPYEITGTTFAPVYAMKATARGDGVAVEWDTGAEVGAAGFFLWRADKAGGPKTLVQDELIPSYSAPQGARYQAVDRVARAGLTYFYTIEEIEDGGARQEYGPFAVTVANDSGKRGAAPDSPGPRQAAAPAAMIAKRAMTAANPAEPLALLSLSAEGVYAVQATDLAAAWGWTESQVISRILDNGVEVRHGGFRVPAVCDEQGAAVYLYARAWNGLFTSSDLYEIQPGRNARLAAGPAAPSAETATWFLETTRAESNRIAVMTLVDDPQSDYWAWEQLIGGQTNANRKSVCVFTRNLDAEGGTGRIAVRLLGGSNSDPSPDHHVIVRLNGTQVGETRWEGKQAQEAQWDVATGLLREGTNTVEVEALRDSGVPYSLVYLDRVDLSYPRALHARDGWLRFPGDGRAVQVGGFSSAPVHVLDVTDSSAARMVLGARRVGTDVSLPATESGHVYVAFEAVGARATAPASGARAAALASPTNDVDWLIIVAPGLEAPSAALASHRAAGGLKTRVVALQDVYAAFGHGIAGPEAIRRFLGYAHRYWRTAPRYIVLAGDGTHDYVNNLGYTDQLLPPALINTPNGLFASDTPYAEVDDQNDRLEAAVGRLPARNATELQTMVQKIVAYEQATGAERTAVLLAADNNDAGGNFESDCAAIGQVLTGRLTVTTAYLGTLGLTNARQRTLSALNSGYAILNYSGHGALDRMAQEGLLTSADVPSLTNASRPALVVSMTCVMGRYSVPGYPCLGEDLLTRVGGGAAGILSPVGLSNEGLAQPLNMALARALVASPGRRLGDIWLEATEEYLDGGFDSYLLGIYNVLSDPAIVVK